MDDTTKIAVLEAELEELRRQLAVLNMKYQSLVADFALEKDNE